MADDLEQEKWEFAKAMFSILLAQGLLIAGLTKMQNLQWDMLKRIGKELGVEFPEPPQLADPAVLEQMQRGIEELNRLFGFDKPDEPVN